MTSQLSTVSETPMLYTGEMVRALMPCGQCAPRKTQMRRIFKMPSWAHPTDDGADIAGETPQICHCDSGCLVDVPCPYGQVGDRIWVKETFRPASKENPRVRVEYQADMSSWGIADTFNVAKNEVIANAKILPGVARPNTKDHWKPSIFMPRALSRITLEILSVRVERLQDISEADAIAEGCEMEGELPKERPAKNGKGRVGWDSAKEWYQDLWNSISLKPKPVYQTYESPCYGEGPASVRTREIVGYISHPWSMEDFDESYPRAQRKGQCGTHRGKPLTVIANPWVWRIEFKRVEPDQVGTSRCDAPRLALSSPPPDGTGKLIRSGEESADERTAPRAIPTT